MLNILFENENFIVLIKPVGISSEGDVPVLIREHLGNSEAYVGVVHRLDTAVSGVMVYAKTKNAAANLSNQIVNGTFKKEYLAVIAGKPEEECGRYDDLLFKDSSKNKSYVVKRERRGVKKASLQYQTVGCRTYGDDTVTLVKVQLLTGRTHQIRVQFASRKTALLGDKKYGSRYTCPIALHSHRLTFISPDTKKEVTFVSTPKNTFPFDIF